MNSNALLVSAFAVLVVAGCGGPAEDTSPAKPMDAQTRLQNIENSNMTPEQKAAAADYVRKGMSQGELQKQAAASAGQQSSK